MGTHVLLEAIPCKLNSCSHFLSNILPTTPIQPVNHQNSRVCLCVLCALPIPVNQWNINVTWKRSWKSFYCAAKCSDFSPHKRLSLHSGWRETWRLFGISKKLCVDYVKGQQTGQKGWIRGARGLMIYIISFFYLIKKPKRKSKKEMLNLRVSSPTVRMISSSLENEKENEQ